MIRKTVCIIDYFAGNIYSISKAFENFGCKIVLTTTPEQIKKADYLVLPGVGAFADGIANIKNQELIEPIQEFCKKGAGALDENTVTYQLVKTCFDIYKDTNSSYSLWLVRDFMINGCLILEGDTKCPLPCLGRK